MGMVRDWAADNWGLIVHTDKEQRDLKYKGNARYDVEIDRQRSGATVSATKYPWMVLHPNNIWLMQQCTELE
jgi:hypothetical protein